MPKLDPSLTVACPTCRARTGEQCELSPSILRFESHKDRIHIARNREDRIDRLWSVVLSTAASSLKLISRYYFDAEVVSNP
jgi:hypothetical protein